MSATDRGHVTRADGSGPAADDEPLVLRLASFAHEASRGIPDEVGHSVEQRILDILGLAIAASTLSTSHAALGFVRDQGGAAQAHAIGLGRTSASWAAFANGVLAHSLDYDDTHLPSVLHPSATVVPAALAAAELVGADGASLVRATAAGLEICVRLGMAGFDRESGNSTFFEHGQHATSICGAVGGAAAAAMLISGTRHAVANAMGVAVSMASGVLEANRTGGTVKRLHCGWAAHAAVTAAQLVDRGFTGPPTALEGRFGFFEAFLHGTYDATEVTRDLGSDWSVPGIFFKPYPANHFTHTGIDAALSLRAKGVRPRDVESAHLAVAAPTVRTIGEPLEVKQRPETGYQAQFSGPYTVAAALSGGSGLGLGLDDFTDELAVAPDRRRLMGRITVGSHADCDAIYPYQFPAILTVVTTDGTEHREAAMVNRGGADNPLTDAELMAKFRDTAGRGLQPEAVEAVAAAAGSLRTAPGLDALVEPLRAGALDPSTVTT